MDSVPDPSWPRPHTPRISAGASYAAHAILARNGAYRALAAFVERHPALERAFTRGERVTKEQLFGCRMCGQCALPATGYACPQTCPKQLRNGPCGGVSMDGRCEVHPEMTCVWVTAYERAEASGHGEDMDRLQRPLDHRRWGQSSWVNYWQGRDTELWTAPREERPLLRRELGLTPR